jgi:hypothetical protein
MSPVNGKSPEIISNKTTFIIGFASIVLSILSFFIVAKLISYTFVQDASALHGTIKDTFIYSAQYFKPEPLERLLFDVGIILMPFLLILFTLTMKRSLNKFKNKTIDILYAVSVIISSLSLILISFLDLSQAADYLDYSRSSDQARTNWNFYFNFAYFHKHLEFYSLILVPLFIYLFLRYYKNSNKNSIVDRAVRTILGLASLLMVGMIFFMNIFGINKINHAWPDTMHLSSVLYPLTQVVAGKTLLVDLIGQYGLYPHFISPIFKIVELTVLNFSLLMAGLLALSFFLIYLFLSKVIKNSMLAFLGFCTVVFWGYLFIKLSLFIRLDFRDHYFQYHPIRFLFPCLLLYLAVRYFENKNKVLYYAGFILSAIGVLWNADSGIVVLGAWILTLCYNELFSKNKSVAVKHCLLHILKGLLISIAVFTIYILAMFLRGGHIINLIHALRFQMIYYYYGFFMEPMPLIHPWNIMILTYLAGLSYSIINLLSGKNSYRSSMVFLLSILGIGLFSYYQGRSLNLNLAISCYPAYLLFAVFAEDLFINIKDLGSRAFSNHILFYLVMFFLLSSPMSLITELTDSNDIKNYINPGVASITSPANDVARNAEFIRKNTSPGEKVYILSDNQSVYYAETKTADPINSPGLSCLILKSDYLALHNALMNNSDNKVFFDTNLNILPEYGLLNITKDKLINEYHYKIIDKSKDKSMMLLMKKGK